MRINIGKGLIRLACLTFAIGRALPALAYHQVTSEDSKPEKVFASEASPISQARFELPGKRQDFQRPYPWIFHADRLQVDWDVLEELNALAREAWTALLRCADNDPAAARALYLNGKCKAAAQLRSTLVERLQSTLLSADTRNLPYEEAFECVDTNGGHVYSCRYLLSESLLKELAENRPSSFDDTQLEFVHRFGYGSTHEPAIYVSILEQVKLPAFHPVFTQVLLETISTGFPFPWGSSACEWGIYSCWFSGSSRGRIWKAPFFPAFLYGTQSSSDRKALAEAVSRLAKEGALTPEQQDRFMADPDFRSLRMSVAGLRILQTLSIGQRSREEFGLWPKATGELLLAMLGAGTIMGAQTMDLHFDSVPAQVLASFRRQHAGDAPPAMSWHNAVHYDTGWEPKYGWQILANAGAWRALAERESPSP